MTDWRKSTHFVSRLALIALLALTTALSPISASGESKANLAHPFKAVNPPRQSQNISLSQDPSLLPPFLPVYQLIAPTVNMTVTTGLANGFSIFTGGIVTATNQTFAGTIAFNVANLGIGAVLQQYGASGGFFAFNARQAFTETLANLDYGPNTICNFLQSKQLFPADTLPAAKECSGQLPLPYEMNLIYLSTLTTPSGKVDALDLNSTDVITDNQVIGQIWKVPLAIAVDIGPSLNLQQPQYIPIKGPGGHLSLLLTGYDQRTPLDNGLPGLQALAMPYYHRQRQLINYYPVITPTLATQQYQQFVQSIYPSAIITPGRPDLVYYAEDPAVVQKSIMPMWTFPEAQALVDGQVVDLRTYTLPGVSGFLPEVSFVSPPPGTIYLPGQPFAITARITGGAAPFTYTLSQEDGITLTTGTTVSGTLTIVTNKLTLPGKPGEPNLHLILSAMNMYGGSSQASLLLKAPNSIYLPITTRSLSLTDLAQISMSAANNAPSPVAPSATHTMGVEWIRYYNGTNPDLPGVPPDANGFYNRMQSLGWSGRFNWGNNSAWEKDWRDCSLGGADCTYGVDRADFAYFSGHGSPARMYFGVKKDAYSFFGGDARFENIRWAGFSSCQTLRAGPYVAYGNPPLSYWFNAFQGAYMFLGFHSNMGDVAFGPRFVDNMQPFTFFGFTFFLATVREAWVLTAFEMNAGEPAYLYAVSNSFDPVNKTLPTIYDTLPPLVHSTITQYRWVWW